MFSLPKTVEFFPVSFERNSRNLRVRINAIRFIFFEADVRPFEIRITVWCKHNQNWLRSFLRFSADCLDSFKILFAASSQACFAIVTTICTLQAEPAFPHSPPSSMLFFCRSVSLANTSSAQPCSQSLITASVWIWSLNETLDPTSLFRTNFQRSLNGWRKQTRWSLFHVVFDERDKRSIRCSFLQIFRTCVTLPRSIS